MVPLRVGCKLQLRWWRLAACWTALLSSQHMQHIASLKQKKDISSHVLQPVLGVWKHSMHKCCTLTQVLLPQPPLGPAMANSPVGGFVLWDVTCDSLTTRQNFHSFFQWQLASKHSKKGCYIFCTGALWNSISYWGKGFVTILGRFVGPISHPFHRSLKMDLCVKQSKKITQHTADCKYVCWTKGIVYMREQVFWLNSLHKHSHLAPFDNFGSLLFGCGFFNPSQLGVWPVC